MMKEVKVGNPFFILKSYLILLVIVSICLLVEVFYEFLLEDTGYPLSQRSHR